MSLDPMHSLGAIKSMTAALAGLGTQLSDAAPTGGFASVLAQVNTEMASLADGGSSAPSGGSAALGSSALGGSLGLGGGPAGGMGGTALTAASLDPLTYAPQGPSGPLSVAPYPEPAGAGGLGAPGPSGSAIVADAEKYLGVPYQWGGTDPATGLDCSGLVQHVFGDFGISLPRTSEAQATVGTPVADVAAARPGDLVFYEPSASGPGHVGIYIGDGKMINAPHTGTVVSITGVGTPSAIRRVLPDSGATAAGFSLDASRGSSSAAMDALGAPPALQSLFAQAGARYGIDPTLLAAVARQESGFQTDAVSGAGAQGLMQLMPGTAAGLGVSPFDPASAIDGAAQLLSGYLRDYGGSVPKALAAYNAGPGAVNAYDGVPPYAETQQYVSSITSMLASAEPGQVTV